MTRFTDPVTVKAARKAHLCDWCGEGIEIGASYVRWCCFDLNHPHDAGAVAMHPDCHEALKSCCNVKFKHYWTPGSYRRGCWCESGTEECDCGIREEAKP